MKRVPRIYTYLYVVACMIAITILTVVHLHSIYTNALGALRWPKNITHTGYMHAYIIRH